MATLATAFPAPTEDEKNLAMLNYILSIFSGWLAPLIIWIIKRESKFVAFHAVQTLFWQLMLIVIGILVGVVVVLSLLDSETRSGSPGVFAFVPLALIVYGWGNLFVMVVFAIKSRNGNWTRLPIVGG
jgi:uncharacterized protein